MWLIFALLSTLTASAKDVLGKTSSTKTNEFTSAFSLQFFGFVFLLPIVLLVGFPKIQAPFWLGLLGAMTVTPTWPVLYMKAIKNSDLSKIIPILALVPLFASFFSIFFDRALPSMVGWLAIVLVMLGIYLVLLKDISNKSSLFDPIVSLKSDSGSRLMLMVAILWGLGAHFTKALTIGSSGLFATLTSTGVSSMIILVRGLWQKKITLNIFQKGWQQLSLLGALHGLGGILTMAALSRGYTPYITGVRRFSIVWSSLAGVYFFNEKLQWHQIVGLVLAMVGLITFVIV